MNNNVKNCFITVDDLLDDIAKVLAKKIPDQPKGI